MDFDFKKPKFFIVLSPMCSKKSARVTVVEFADMVYNAYQKRLADEKAYVSTMQALL